MVRAMRSNPVQRAKLADLQSLLSDLKRRLAGEYGNAIGLQAGFFFVDGD